MRINGFLGVSLVDYPGKVCSIIYTSPCNFRCPFCHNAALVPVNKDTMEEEDVFTELSDRSRFVDAVTITGGEPTLQPDLKQFLAQVKSMGLLVKLDTNGYMPESLQELIDGDLVDYIAMDIKGSIENYHMAAGIEVAMNRIYKSIQIVMNSGVNYEFRATAVPGIINEKTVEGIGEMVEGAKHFTLQQYENGETFDPEYNKISPYTSEKLEKFKAILEKYVKSVKIANTETAGSAQPTVI